MSVLERIKNGRHDVDLEALRPDPEAGRAAIAEARGVAERVRGFAARVGREAAEAAGTVSAETADAADEARAGAADAVTGAGDTIARLGEAASRAGAELGRGLGRELARAGRDLRLEERVPELARRVREEVASADLGAIVHLAENERPGAAVARKVRDAAPSARGKGRWIFVGLLAGVAAAVAAIVFLDPARGAERRAAAKARAARLRDGIAEQAGPRIREAADKARQLAAERGIVATGGENTVTESSPVEVATATAEMPEETGSFVDIATAIAPEAIAPTEPTPETATRDA